MKIDKDVRLLEKSIKEGDFVRARNIIELNPKHFSAQAVRNKLSMDALTLVNIVNQMNEGENKDLYSREIQLIVAYINSLARKGNFSDIKRYTSLHSDLLSNPKIYDMLNSDAKIFVAPPKQDEVAALPNFS